MACDTGLLGVGSTTRHLHGTAYGFPCPLPARTNSREGRTDILPSPMSLLPHCPGRGEDGHVPTADGCDTEPPGAWEAPPVGPRHSAHLRLAPAGPQPQSLHGGPAVPASAPCPSCSAWAPLGARACLPGADVGPGGGMGSPAVSSDDVLTGAGPGGGREGGSVCAGVGPVAGPLGRRCRDWRPSVSGR